MSDTRTHTHKRAHTHTHIEEDQRRNQLQVSKWSEATSGGFQSFQAVVGGTLAQEEHAGTLFSIRPRCKVTQFVRSCTSQQSFFSLKQDGSSIVFDFA